MFGIGDKGATNLLQKYGSLDNVYKHLGELSEVTRKKLETSRDSAFMSRDLATLYDTVPMDFDLESCRVKHFDSDGARKIFSELGFKSLSKRIDDMYGSERKQGSLF